MSTENLKANQIDIENASKNNLAKPLINRLKLNEDSISSIVKSITEIKNQPDPIGKILEEWSQPNGLKFSKISVPLGVLGVIYESRPNVTSDVASLCFKSGNSVILKGGSEAFYSNLILSKLFRRSLKKNRVNETFKRSIHQG